MAGMDATHVNLKTERLTYVYSAITVNHQMRMLNINMRDAYNISFKCTEHKMVKHASDHSEVTTQEMCTNPSSLMYDQID